MRRTIPMLVAIAILVAAPALSQDENSVVKSFGKVVARVDSFFAESPTVFSSENSPYSPTGEVHSRYSYEGLGSKFDIQRTSSLVTPFVAYIVVGLHATSNRPFGDQDQGFSEKDAAINEARLGTCTSAEKGEAEWCTGNVRIDFAFQGGAWIFKRAQTEIEDRHTRLVFERDLINSPEWEEALNGD